jgi:cysteine dioxygenase
MAIDVVSTTSSISRPTVFGVKGVDAVRSDAFEELVLSLKEALGPSSGLTSDDVDVGYLQRLMEDYDGFCDTKWTRYAFGDASKGYTRNLVDEGNGKSNLVSLSLQECDPRHCI